MNRVLNKVRDLLGTSVTAKAFPGASLVVSSPKLLTLASGKFTYALDAPLVSPDTAFDLASLTKVICTTTMAMLLYERGNFDLDQAVKDVVPEFLAGSKDAGRSLVTYRMLLSHSSGLPAHGRFFEQASDREQLLQLVFTTPLESVPLARACYSDIGFIILGVALERITGETLEAFCRREIFGPLDMTRTLYRPTLESRHSYPPTVNDRIFRKKIIQGEVNDENAWVMGGIAGHAGLFAPATDVAKFAQCILRGGAPILKPKTVRLFTTRQQLPHGSTRTLGWDTPSAPSQSGKYFSPQSFGHLGYTGTSLWIDPQRQISITLLTNRTWPDNNSEAIKKVRPAIHDAIIEAIHSSESAVGQ